jgi:hypothetical protein
MTRNELKKLNKIIEYVNERIFRTSEAARKWKHKDDLVYNCNLSASFLYRDMAAMLSKLKEKK